MTTDEPGVGWPIHYAITTIRLRDEINKLDIHGRFL